MKKILKQQLQNRKVFKKGPLPSNKFQKKPIALKTHTHTQKFVLLTERRKIASKIFDRSAHHNLEFYNLHKNGEKMFSKNLDEKI